jgi:hypothetical protein
MPGSTQGALTGNTAKKSDDTWDAFELSQLLFVVGHVAFKHIVYLELVQREWNRQKQEKELGMCLTCMNERRGRCERRERRKARGRRGSCKGRKKGEGETYSDANLSGVAPISSMENTQHPAPADSGTYEAGPTTVGEFDTGLRAWPSDVVSPATARSNGRPMVPLF